MRWHRTFQTIDVHCEGEIGRIVTSGILRIPGNSIAEKLMYFNSQDNEAQQVRTPTNLRTAIKRGRLGGVDPTC